MPRSMWRGAISFGMVAIPVRLYLATESKSVSFRLLCPNDLTPIKNKRWCTVEDKEVGWNDVVRGYEVGKDEYVVIEDKDLDNLPLNTTHSIDIVEFCADQEIEAGVYLKSAYYLEPEPVGTKPYALLRAALEKTGKVAIGKIALRDREHLCRLALHENGLLMNTLHWPDEIRSAAELSIPQDGAEIRTQELDMAVMLVENLSAHFEPERYSDQYREALLKVVEAKLANTPLERPATPEPAKVTDLMAALKASVEAAQSSKREGTASAARSEPSGRKRESSDTAEPARRRKAS
ncbi:MAG TPA: Ku protein [Candidatus Acidoferrales bacterium]|jgi:DNA end-binding protein Ku|nr:Ku protein [Candidatus Acidoferrales bacterium]